MGRHFENNGGMFSTQTAPQYYLRRVYVVMVFVFLISIILFSIFKQYFHNWDGSIVIFVTTLVCLVALFYNSRKMSPVLLNFYGTRLHMRDKFNVEFDIGK